MFFNFTKLNHFSQVPRLLPLSYENIFPKKLWMSTFPVLKSIVLVKQYEEDDIRKRVTDLILFKRNKINFTLYVKLIDRQSCKFLLI